MFEYVQDWLEPQAWYLMSARKVQQTNTYFSVGRSRIYKECVYNEMYGKRKDSNQVIV